MKDVETPYLPIEKKFFSIDKKSRLTGVDLCRGIAACAVVVQHVGNGVNNDFTVSATAIKTFSSFAVPFFLATSLYLIINKLYVSKKYSLKSRYMRILIPYAFWSVFYLVLKFLEHLHVKDFGNTDKIWSDPLAIVFFGDSSYQLYFLPLLFLATVLVKIAEYLIIKRVKFKILLTLFVLSLIIYELLLDSGNSYTLTGNVAFEKILEVTLPQGNENPLIRLILAELAWSIRCLPYIFMAMLLNYPLIKAGILKFDNRATVILLMVFIVTNTLGKLFFPESVYELIRGYSFLLFAISLSTKLKENGLLASLSLCSFGIYLIHIQVLHVFKMIAITVVPQLMTQISVLTMVILVTPTFLVSWIATSILMRKKLIAKLMFGV